MSLPDDKSPSAAAVSGALTLTEEPYPAAPTDVPEYDQELPSSKKDRKKKKRQSQASTDILEPSEPTHVDEQPREIFEEPAEFTREPSFREDEAAVPIQDEQDFQTTSSSKKSKKDKKKKKSTDWTDIAVPTAVVAGGAAAGAALAGLLVDTDGKSEPVEKPRDVHSTEESRR